MKRILLAMILVTALSCRADQDAPAETNSVAGIWKMEKTSTVSDADLTTVFSEYLPDDCKQKSTFEFTEDGKYIINDYNSIGQECVHVAETKSDTYHPAENKLFIDTTEPKVLELTASRLAVIVEDDYDYNGDGISDYLEYIFRK